MPLRRDRLISDVGPDAKGSKPGIEACAHMPEKSGMDGPRTGACPKAGAAAAATNVTGKRKFRVSVMLSSPIIGSARDPPSKNKLTMAGLDPAIQRDRVCGT